MSTPISARANRDPKPDNTNTSPNTRRFHLRAVLASGLAATALAFIAFGLLGRDNFKTPNGSDSTVENAPVTLQGANQHAMRTTPAQTNAWTPALPAPRLARKPYIQWTTTSSAHIVWDTKEASSSSVDYALVSPTTQNTARMSTHAAAWKRVAGAQRALRHIVKLTGLRAASVYKYRVASNGYALFQGRFQTDKKAGQAARIAIWGDSGVGDQWQYGVAAQIEKARPDCLVHTGDLIYPKGAARDFDPEFFRVYARLLSRVPFYGSLGNHDVGTKNGAPFLANFVFPTNGPASLPPERNYSFDYAGAHWVVIDSNQSEEQMRNVLAPWLGRDLGASRALWKFAVFHHPPFSSGEHGDEIRTQRALVPTFARLHVDIVFNGHDHGYERWKPRAGVVYIITAGGGANLYKRTRRDPMTASYHNEIHSWTQLDLNGKTLRGTQIGSNGRALDTWTMTKP